MIDYSPFWNTLSNSSETTYSLINKHHISSAIIDKLRKNKPMNTTTLNDLCRIFNCQIQDIAQYIPSDTDQTLQPGDTFTYKTFQSPYSAAGVKNRHTKYLYLICLLEAIIYNCLYSAESIFFKTSFFKHLFASSKNIPFLISYSIFEYFVGRFSSSNPSFCNTYNILYGQEE